MAIADDEAMAAARALQVTVIVVVVVVVAVAVVGVGWGYRASCRSNRSPQGDMQLLLVQRSL
jgi:hypothetical protein